MNRKEDAFPLLQMAVDVLNLSRALQLIEEGVKGGVDWIEVGTPLIKSEGMNAVREIKKRYRNKVVVADMKTMDVGALESSMAARSGADVVCILGLASNETILEAKRAGEKYGSEIMVDLLEVKDKIKRAKQLEALGVDYLCIHVSIDAQMVGASPFEYIKDIKKAVNIPLAVAGGINSETAGDIVKAGADILIVGGALIKAQNVTEAAKLIKRAMLTGERIETGLYKKYSHQELREAFKKVSVPNIADAMHREGVMCGLQPVKKGLIKEKKLIGPAFTVRTINGDWAKAVEAIDAAREGDVIVIDAQSGKLAVWGELASWSCKMKGVAGVVIDGAIRDVDDIREMDFPAFARHQVPNAGEPRGYGEMNIEIECGGQKVRPGDWIVGDDSGLIVVPKERAQEIANRAIDIMERENRYREEIKRGSTLSSVLELAKWEKV